MAKVEPNMSRIVIESLSHYDLSICSRTTTVRSLAEFRRVFSAIIPSRVV
ncbi:putative transforming growth factor-beta receptor-associated [Sesbania bispinosa]|nr:putative transforming growth factor-beta receptor-associated [Sesbania bispinosa]